MTATSATNGSPLAGALAASLQAIEIHKLLAGEREHLAAGRELLFDARHQVHCVSRLVRNPRCRFGHDRWALGATRDLPLRDALALAGGPPERQRLFVPDHAFLSKRTCPDCGLEEAFWRLRVGAGAGAPACPRCGALRPLRGFDLVEPLVAGDLPAALLPRPLAERGLRPGEVFGVASLGGPPRYFVLEEEPPRPGAPASAGATDVVVAGLGNIGSFLAPQLARLPEVGSVTLCDPDGYEAGQQAGQDIPASAVGRNKAEVQAERLRAIRPELPVTALPAPVEELPLGALRGAITVSCLDSRAARLRLAARAWRVGSPFVDAAVGGGTSLLARSAVYLPEDDAACFECAFEASDYAQLDQTYPCRESEPAAVATGLG